MAKEKQQELVPATPVDVAAGEAPPSKLIELALVQKVDVSVIERLVALEERIQVRNARAAFMDAMARFKATCPPVPRRSENTQFSVTKNGMKVARTYASLEDIEATIRGPLGECGLAFRWSDSRVDNGLLTTACIVSHVGGHSESSSVVIPVAVRSGANEQQQYGSAMTYAQRYSLIQALGLTSCDEDVDGEDAGEVERITPEQVDTLEALLFKCPDGTKRRMLEDAGVDSLDRIPASNFQRYVRKLEATAKQEGGR